MRMKDRIAEAINNFRMVGEPIFVARKVLEAMREPSDEMYEASGYGDRGIFRHDWQAMIDAALSAPGPFAETGTRSVATELDSEVASTQEHDENV